MTFFKLNSLLQIRVIHKWLSLFVGVQLLIWLGTGLYFNLMDHSKDRGNEYRVNTATQAKAADFDLFDVNLLHKQQVNSELAQQVKLIWLLDKPYYHVIYEQGAHSYQPRRSALFDGVTGNQFTLTAELVLELAKLSYSGSEKLSTPVLLNPPFDDDVRQQNPMWQVETDDSNSTAIYLDAVTGQVVRHANDDSRLKDLMMKLHFMDYANTGGFNHWLIILFAIATLLLSITGVTWLLQQYQHGLLTLSFNDKPHKVAVSFQSDQTLADISAATGDTVLEGLAKSHVYLSSSCGGGGTCGQCVFLTKTSLPITPAERQQLTALQLMAGYRLGCQHKISAVDEIEVHNKSKAQNYVLEVVASEFITPFIKQVKFKVKSGEQLSYRAGAYMQFEVPAGKGLLKPNDIPEHFAAHWQSVEQGNFPHDKVNRHYSMANFDSEGDELIFNIRWQNLGAGSSYLGSLKVGQNIVARGPFCDFFASENPALQRFFIGAGSGLAPLRAIIFEQLKKYDYQGDITLIYGARTDDDLLYHAQVLELEHQHDNFTYIPCLSSAGENWQGEVGYVQQQLARLIEQGEKQGVEITNAEFYLCGPKGMMKEVEALIVNAGVPSEQIFKDSFSRK